MIIEDTSLYLYNLTLKQPSGYNQTVLGQFLGEKKSQEVFVSNGTAIQLLRPNTETGKVEILCLQNLLGVVFKIEKIRPIASTKDSIALTSDSGNIIILEFDLRLGRFVSKVQESYAKNGFTRLNQGHYLSIDPSNRVILLSALEQNKLLYKIQSKDDGYINLSSPLTHTSKNIVTLQICSLDTGYDNPLFAAIECDYNKYENQQFNSQSRILLNYYEFDQGINHLVKKKSIDQIPNNSNYLVPLPSHIGGILVFGESWMLYDNSATSKSPARKFAAIPSRNDDSTPTIIINHVYHKLKKKDFFILLQSSEGDLFKLTCMFDEDKEVLQDIYVTYFDTIPVCKDLSILKGGFLFANVLNDDKQFYQFDKLGDNITDSTLKTSEFSELDYLTKKVKFTPRAIENLSLVDTADSLCSIVESSLVHRQISMELVTLSSNAHIKTLVQGIPTSTIVSSELPLIPTDIHSTKLFANSTSDDYLVISSSLDSKTLVLSIGENVEEVEDSNFVTNHPTILVQQVGVSSVVQVYSNGIRHVKHTKKEDKVEKMFTDWYSPAGINILHASANSEQVIIALSNSEICYFEIDADDQLIEYQERVEMTSSVKALAILADASRKSYFAVVGCSDETIQVLSLQGHNCLETVSLQALSANCNSLELVSYKDFTIIHIGMVNGLYVWSRMDEITGDISSTRIKYVGSKPVNLYKIKLNSEQVGIVVISSSAWLSYNNQDNEVKLSSLLDIDINSCTSIVSEDIGGEAVVGISKNNLIFFTIGDGDTADFSNHDNFVTSSIKLRYSPKKMLIDHLDDSNVIYVIESEYNSKGNYPITDLGSKPSLKSENTEEHIEPDRIKNSWASSIQVLKQKESEIIQSIELPSSNLLHCITKLKFTSMKENTRYVVVGMTKNQKFLPTLFEANYLLTFKVLKNRTLEFLHQTEIDHQPTCMLAFNGRLLVGMGNSLRLYDLGQKQLLRKSSTLIEYHKRFIRILHQGGERIVVADASNSISFMKFDNSSNIFVPIADDVMKRQITSIATLDYDTVIGGDKFGNIFVSRLSKLVSRQSDEDWGLIKSQEPFLNGASSRLTSVCEFHIHDIPTSLYKGTLVYAGTQESIIYSGLQGTIGLLLPLLSKQEIEFLVKLELAMRQEFFEVANGTDDVKVVNLLGKDHLKFRSYYNPVKNVIDGDLIEKFYTLKMTTKLKISSKVNRNPSEIERKISDLRGRCAF